MQEIVFTLSTSTAEAVFIGDFPGLATLVEKSDAIVVLRITQVEPPAIRPYGTYECFVERTLKGDVPSKERAKFSLMDATGFGTMSSTLQPLPYGSRHLMFLTKRPESRRQAKYEYYTIQYVGANVCLPPLGSVEVLEGDTCKEKIESLLTRTAEYNRKRYEKTQSLLKTMSNSAALDDEPAER